MSDVTNICQEEAQSANPSSMPNLSQLDVDANSMPPPSSTEPSIPQSTVTNKRKARPHRSDVWNYFEKIMIEGEERAECLACGNRLSAKGTNGTSHLKDHINLRCSKQEGRAEKGQLKLNFNRRGDGSGTASVENHNFSQEVSRKELARMVVMHEYPLSIVDHIGFKRYSSSLNPNFKLICRQTLKNDIMRMYESEKAKMRRTFELHKGRIAITTDMWTATHQRKGYMAVTAHYIDDQWKLHNRIVRFVYVPCPHTTEVLGEVLLQTLSVFNIHEKVSSVVMDNCATNDKMIELLLHRFDSSTLLLGGAFLHVRCSAHILNLIVQDGLNVIASGIKKVRDCVLKVDCSKALEIDCATRWNSTYTMLQSAFPYREVFYKLKIQHPRFGFVIPSDDEWSWAAQICSKLSKFNKATKVFSGRLYPTSNLFFRRVCQIKLALKDWMSSSDAKVKEMTQVMLSKFDKYWSSVSELLAIAAILDPRDKMECVDWYFNKIYGDTAFLEIDRVKSMLFQLLNEYRENDTHAEIQSSASQLAEDDLEDDFCLAKKQKKRRTNVRSELEYYLEDPPLPDCKEFDVLNFWKSDLKYPTLRKIAKDILAIPATTVASECAFSAGGRVASPHRSSLHVETVEALMCLGNWWRADCPGFYDKLQACVTLLEDVDVGEPSSDAMAYDNELENNI